MATARAHPTRPFLPRHYYTTLGPPSPCIVVARVVQWGWVGPCGRHAGPQTVLPVDQARAIQELAFLRSPCRITNRPPRYTRKSLREKPRAPTSATCMATARPQAHPTQFRLRHGDRKGPPDHTLPPSPLLYDVGAAKPVYSSGESGAMGMGGPLRSPS